MEVSDAADISSQAVKKRMPPEIKQKLAKVARLAVLIIPNLNYSLFVNLVLSENCLVITFSARCLLLSNSF